MFRNWAADLLARGVLATAVLLGLAASLPHAVAAIGPGVAIVTTEIREKFGTPVTSVPVGTSVHPSFVVSGLSGPATGSITVFKWNNGTCSGLWSYGYGGVLSSNGHLDAYFLAETATEPSTISYRGDYQGNGTYGAASGQCTSVTFTKATPSVALEMHTGAHATVTSVKIGATIHAFASVTGSADTPTGSVRIRQWPNGSCSGASSLVGPYTLGAGEVDTPFSWAMNTEGSFSFRADYLGDSSYIAATSPCLTVTVEKYTPILDSEVHNAAHDPFTTFLIGTTAHLSGTLSGSVGTPTGTVAFREYTNGSCDGGASFVKSIPAEAVMDPAGNPLSVDVPYTIHWQLAYSGDDTYAAVTGPCLTATWKAPSTVGLTVHDANHDAVTSAYVGTPLHVRVKVDGGFGSPTGSVTPRRYANATCTGSGTAMGTSALNAGVVDKAGLDVSFASPGTYSFRVSYPGDASYVGEKSACTTVTITAVPSTPKPTTAPTSAPTTAPTAATTPAPTALPTTSPEASSIPGPSPIAAPSPSTAASAGAPGATNGAGPPGSAGPSDGPPVVAGATTAPPTGDAGSSPITLIVLIALLFLTGMIGLVFARRRRHEALQPS